MSLDVTVKARRLTLKSIIFRKRLLESISKAVGKTVKELPLLTSTVAKKSGVMRTAIKQNIIDQAREQEGEKNITLSLSNEVIDQISSNVEYTKNHTPGHPDFNIHFSTTRYQAPHTPGTKPIERAKIIKGIGANLRSNITKELKSEGFT